MKTRYIIFLVIFLKLTFVFFLLNRSGQYFSHHKYSNLFTHDDPSQSQFSSPRNISEETAGYFNNTPFNSSMKYRINTEGCKITNLPLFDEETSKLFLNDTELIWNCNKSLVGIKRFNETWLKFDNHDLVGIKCFWRDLKRGKDDDHFDYGQFNGPIGNLENNMAEHEFVSVACFNNTKNDSDVLLGNYKDNVQDIVYQQIIPLIPVKPKMSKSKVPNILLLAIDSTSYVNFKRHFIRTEKFLNKNKFTELKGYNKVGANTFPNMIPFFTGHHPDELVSPKKLGNTYFDDWPYVWKKYSDQGFVTQFLEEMPNAGLFNFFLKGFHKQPTDYQTRPWQMELKKEEYNQFCYKDKTEMEHSLEYTFDFIKAMRKRNQKYFAYISICELTHDWHNGAHYMDVPYLNFFQNIFIENLHQDTIVLFFSDHGLRFGKFRETHSGEMENRLPFMFIHLPETLNISKENLDNLKHNQQKLTTPFDTHATLVHLIEGKPDITLKYGISLFEEIKSSRTCKDAGIPDVYCSCHEDILVKNTEFIKQDGTISKLMNKLNSITNDYRDKCEEYKFDSFKSIYNRTMDHVYLTQFYVNPGKALFETVLRGFDKDTRFKVIGEMTRINRYGDQANCMESKILKNYCFCK